ncbi:MAG: hypothetical protein AABZ30_06315 [Myxococcota bacterium]
MIFDVDLSPLAESFVVALNKPDRDAFYRSISLLCANPHADGGMKSFLPFPYLPGTLGCSFGDFWVTYWIESERRIVIAAVAWNPESGRRR